MSPKVFAGTAKTQAFTGNGFAHQKLTRALLSVPLLEFGMKIEIELILGRPPKVNEPEILRVDTSVHEDFGQVASGVGVDSVAC